MNKQFNNRISFIEAIGRTDYAKNVKDMIASLILDNFSDNNNRIFLYRKISENEPESIIFMIEHKLKIHLNGRFFDVPLLIYFTDSFPLSAPEIYIENRTKYIHINKTIPTFFISRKDLKVNYQLYIKWEKEAENILKTLNYLKDLFSKFFPIYSSKELNYFSGLCSLDFNNIILVNKITDSDKENVESSFSNKKKVSANRFYSDEKLDVYTPNEDDELNSTIIENNKFFNENEFKENLIDKLKKILLDKIKEEIEKQDNINEKIKDFIKKMKEEIIKMDKIIEKEYSINHTVNTLNKNFEEINSNINIEEIKTIENFFNSDIKEKCNSLIEINSKKTLERYKKIETLEEFLIICRTAFQKNLIPFDEMIKIFRNGNRNLFFLKNGLERHPWE